MFRRMTPCSSTTSRIGHSRCSRSMLSLSSDRGDLILGLSLRGPAWALLLRNWVLRPYLVYSLLAHARDEVDAESRRSSASGFAFIS